MEVIATLGIFFLGLPYIFLGFLAYKHFNASGSIKMLAMGPWWPFYSRYYDDEGKIFCKYGKIIIVIAAPISIISILS